MSHLTVTSFYPAMSPQRSHSLDAIFPSTLKPDSCSLSGLSPLPGETSSYLSLPGESTEDNLILPNLTSLNDTTSVDSFNLPTYDDKFIQPFLSGETSTFYHSNQGKPTRFIMTCNSALSPLPAYNISQGNNSAFPPYQAMQVSGWKWTEVCITV